MDGVGNGIQFHRLVKHAFGVSKDISVKKLLRKTLIASSLENQQSNYNLLFILTASFLTTNSLHLPYVFALFVWTH
jgi:hypothetical protein